MNYERSLFRSSGILAYAAARPDLSFQFSESLFNKENQYENENFLYL